MKETPLFSVLIAQYNNARFLDEAIESVIKQTYTNWEIIIVDDASTDNSFEIYEKYKANENIEIYYNNKNIGCGYTKSRCVEFANGEIAGFLDPDDTLLPNAIELMIAHHLRNPEWSIIFSRHYVCDANMNILSVSRKYEVSDKSYFETQDFHAEHFVSFKQEYYNKTVGLNPLYKAGVDADLNFLLEEVGVLGVIDEIIYKHRKNNENAVTANYSKSQFWNILVQYDTCKRRGLDIEENLYKFYLSSIAYTQQDLIEKSKENVKQSLSYRLGKIILCPFKLLRKVTKI